MNKIISIIMFLAIASSVSTRVLAQIKHNPRFEKSYVPAAKYDRVLNGILLIKSNNRSIDLVTPDRIKCKLIFNLELFTDGKEKQYCFFCSYGKNNNYLMFPTNCKLLLKTGKGDIIELNALYSYETTDGKDLGGCYFPISIEQLNSIIEDGIIKLRIGAIANIDHHYTFAEKEWKMNFDGEIGKEIDFLSLSIDNRLKKKQEEYSKTQSALNSEF